MPRIPLRYGQKWLFERMQSLGYRSNLGGICYGLAYLGMQAILAEDLDTFDQRLATINSIPVESFPEAIAAEQQKHPTEKKTTPNTALEIPAFFDGIELNFQAHLHPELFEEKSRPHKQDAMLSAPLVASQNIEQQGGITKISEFSGCYTERGLNKYFHSLRSTLMEAKPPCEQPLSLILHSSQHTITIGYDPKKNTWQFIDANRLPTQYFSTDAEIAKSVSLAFSHNGITNFQTEIFTTKKNQAALTTQITAWQQQKTWKKIHAVTTTKAQLIDSHKSSWLYTAAYFGQTSCVNELLTARAHPNQALMNGVTPLYAAATRGHIEAVNTLLEGKSNPNIASRLGSTPLLIAVDNGNHALVKLLLEKKADINQTSQKGNTPLSIAAQNGHFDIVKLLLKKRADTNIHNQKGRTALHIAIQQDHGEIAKLLMQKKANPNIPDQDNVSPLQLAQTLKQEEIIPLLQHYAIEFKAPNPEDSFKFFTPASPPEHPAKTAAPATKKTR